MTTWETELEPRVGDDRGVGTGADRAPWDEETDVLVIGFGAAGAGAAIEARAGGARVLVADRFEGGGATARSAGVVYFGGGTRLQKAAGYEDSPEQMYRYLALEAEDAVSEATLREYCERSVEHFDWLCELGVPFPASGEALKTSYPPDDCTLYFSGNELCPPYSDAATPAPRGHRALGKSLTGHLIFDGLRGGAASAGASVRPHTRAERLVIDDAGRVLGAELVELRDRRWVRAAQKAAELAVSYGGGFSRRATDLFTKQLERLERENVGRRRLVRARGGVVLAAGGFVFNPALMRRYAPNYAAASMRLGTAGDDGRGIFLGRAVGGAIDRMDRCCAWRFINPPTAWVRGILVGPDGSRICNEELYGSKIGEYLADEHGGRGALLLDADAMAESKRQLRSETMGGFQLVFGVANDYLNHVESDSLEGLADRLEIPREKLLATVESYNASVAEGRDPMGKSAGSLAPLKKAPFYAVNCDIDTIKFPTPCITLGGLVVDGTSQRVMGEDGQPVGGLYAAGRNAVGVSSDSYVSGLSVSDGIFSGRNAGAHASARARTAQVSGAPGARVSSVTTREPDAAPGALEVAKRSPELVLARDKAGWLALFTEDASVEDPVGAGAYAGPRRLSAFWDAFIAPQRSVTFLPKRDFEAGDVAIRYVTISSVTPVSDEPFELPVIIEYHADGERLSRLRAFWEPRHAVSWHAKQGLRGLGGLMAHGLRTTTGLGLGSALGFSKALKPGVSRTDGERLAREIALATQSHEAWIRFCDHARVSVGTRGAAEARELATNPESAWERSLEAAAESGPALEVDEVIVAGDYVACVLASQTRACAALLHVDEGRVVSLSLLWEA